MKKEKLYNVWRTMNRRCYSPNDCNYHKYGAKGIRVCSEWRRKCDGGKNGYENFKEWALNNGYQIGLTIDRINPYKDYSPNNCQWVDYHTQNSKLTISTKNNSGYIGISRTGKKNDKWRARIFIEKEIVIGYFDNKKDAVESRNKYIIKHNLNYPIQEWIGEEGYTKETYRNVYEYINEGEN